MVWRFVDGKPGHENQTAGLIRALEKLQPLDVHTLEAMPAWKALLAYIGVNFPAVTSTPAPDLIIGAGHRTHLSMLAARRARGGRTVVLMKPSLPTGWFDLCVVPEHDDITASGNVIVTRGVLNTIVPGKEQDAAESLIMIGGPSSHYQWDEAQLVAAIQAIVNHDDTHWTLTTSRRTPDTTTEQLRSIQGDRLVIVPWQQTDRDWVPARLQAVSMVWVTEDSVSMLYEALTSGATCGILPVPHTKKSRISDSVQKLIKEDLVTGYANWQAGGEMSKATALFNEAARVATEIKKRWFNTNA